MQVSLWRKINMGRDHRWAGPHMSEYLDGELSTRKGRRMEAHSSICPDCHRVLGTLREMVSAVGRMGRPHPPPADLVAERVSARIEQAPPS